MHVPASAAFPGSLDEGRTAVSGSFLGVPAVSKHTRTTQASPPPRRPISVCVYIERDPPPSRRMPRRASREQVVFGRDGVSPHSHALRFAAEVTLETALCSAGEQGPGCARRSPRFMAVMVCLACFPQAPARRGGLDTRRAVTPRIWDGVQRDLPGQTVAHTTKTSSSVHAGHRPHGAADVRYAVAIVSPGLPDARTRERAPPRRSHGGAPDTACTLVSDGGDPDTLPKAPFRVRGGTGPRGGVCARLARDARATQTTQKQRLAHGTGIYCGRRQAGGCTGPPVLSSSLSALLSALLSARCSLPHRGTCACTPAPLSALLPMAYAATRGAERSAWCGALRLDLTEVRTSVRRCTRSPR